MLDADTLERIRRRPPFAHYFRYPLALRDWRIVTCNGQPLGCYATKPLYGRLDARGRVDRRGGYSGQVAILYVPEGRPAQAQLLFTRLTPDRIASPDGRRNWPVIRKAAQQALTSALAAQCPGGVEYPSRR